MPPIASFIAIGACGAAGTCGPGAFLTTSSTERSAGASGTTISVPARPPPTCVLEMPCMCEWYQYVPGGCVVGTLNVNTHVLGFGAYTSDLNTLSTYGSTCQPCVWKLVSLGAIHGGMPGCSARGWLK